LPSRSKVVRRDDQNHPWHVTAEDLVERNEYAKKHKVTKELALRITMESKAKPQTKKEKHIRAPEAPKPLDIEDLEKNAEEEAKVREPEIEDKPLSVLLQEVRQALKDASVYYVRLKRAPLTERQRIGAIEWLTDKIIFLTVVNKKLRQSTKTEHLILLAQTEDALRYLLRTRNAIDKAMFDQASEPLRSVFCPIRNRQVKVTECTGGVLMITGYEQKPCVNYDEKQGRCLRQTAIEVTPGVWRKPTEEETQKLLAEWNADFQRFLQGERERLALPAPRPKGLTWEDNSYARALHNDNYPIARKEVKGRPLTEAEIATEKMLVESNLPKPLWTPEKTKEWVV